jgi:hypothetical protein
MVLRSAKKNPFVRVLEFSLSSQKNLQGHINFQNVLLEFTLHNQNTLTVKETMYPVIHEIFLLRIKIHQTV